VIKKTKTKIVLKIGFLSETRFLTSHMSLPAVFATALKHYLPNTATTRLNQAEAERRDILRAFPLEQWATLPLAHYPLDTDQPNPTFCYWLEFKSKALGPMGTRNAKHPLI
jgi:hypothetical protein